MIIVADNLRITLPAINLAVNRLDPEPIQQMVAACRHANVLDPVIMRVARSCRDITNGAVFTWQ